MPLTDNINLAEKSDHLFFTGLIEADTHIFFGSIVARNAAGNLVPASDAADLRVAGVAEQEVDNTGGAAGAKFVVIKRSPRWVPNSGTQPVTASGLQKPCYIEDDNTVASQTTHGIPAGIALELSADESLVLVDFLFAPLLDASPAPVSSGS